MRVVFRFTQVSKSSTSAESKFTPRKNASKHATRTLNAETISLDTHDEDVELRLDDVRKLLLGDLLISLLLHLFILLWIDELVLLLLLLL